MEQSPSHDLSPTTPHNNPRVIVRLEQVHDDQRQGRHIKCVNDIYYTIFAKKFAYERIPSALQWQYLKCYSESLNRLIRDLVSSSIRTASLISTRVGEERPAEIRRLLDSLDHCLLRWAGWLAVHDAVHRQFELYLQTVLATASVRAVYYQRLNQTSTAYDIMLSADRIFQSLQSSCRATTQMTCAEYAATLGGMFADHSLFQMAIPQYGLSLRLSLSAFVLLCRTHKRLSLPALSKRDAHLIRASVSPSLTVSIP